MGKRKINTVTETLRRAILESEQSFNELARQTGLDVGNLHKFAHGQRGLSLDNLDTLAEHFGFVLVRPGRGSKLRRGAARMILGAAIAASQADPGLVNDAYAALVSVGHSQSEARRMIEGATATGRQFASAADLLAVIYRSS